MPDDLHPVEQRPGDGLGDVGRRDEQHPRQVEVDLEVVVAERVVLCRVEHLEQGRRRVAPEVGPELVDLVEDDDRVHGPGLAQARAPAGPAGPRRRCGGGRGSRPRRARRRATRGRTCARGRWPPTRRATSCRPPGARPGPGWRPSRGRRRAPGPRSACSLRTARCSRMRSFTSSSPSWSASRIRDASAMSSRSSDSMPQGSSSTVSSQVRIQPVSGLWSLVRSSLSTSRSTALRTCSGRSRVGELGPVVVGVAPSPSPRSPPRPLSSLRMASSWRREQELALRLLHALLDVGLDLLAQSRGRRGCRGPNPRTRRSRASTSSVSSTSTFWPSERSGE